MLPVNRRDILKSSLATAAGAVAAAGAPHVVGQEQPKPEAAARLTQPRGTLLDPFPHVALACLPTPLEPLPRLSEHLGGPRLFVKRDDQTGLAMGGNKARKLEFLAGHALATGCDTLVTIGGVQSNHARQTAAAAARLGMRCELLLPRVVPRDSTEYEKSGNVLLDQLLGARLQMLPAEKNTADTLESAAAELRENGRKPYVIPTGGSTARGALGYVQALFELLAQIRERDMHVDAIVVPVGSAGTVAGLLAGLVLAETKIPVVAAAVMGSAKDRETLTRELTRQVLGLLGRQADAALPELLVTDRTLGRGYGLTNDAVIEAVKRTAQVEGLLLDPVYTGKAMAALFDLVRRKHFNATDKVVFWHTGGTPGLFAYRDVL
jgi:D-cysteine desulfhydrase family pyridoxal phosphate-dependent enzyme